MAVEGETPRLSELPAAAILKVLLKDIVDLIHYDPELERSAGRDSVTRSCMHVWSWTHSRLNLDTLPKYP